MVHSILTKRLYLMLNIKKELTCHLVDFAVTANHREKMKERENIYNYQDLARELKSCET